MLDSFLKTNVLVRVRPWLVGALLAAFFAISLLSVRHKTLTYDEQQHYIYGLQILSLNSDRLPASEGRTDDSKMPFSVLNALPGKIAQALPASSLQNALAKVTTGRLATILFSGLIAWLVYCWSKSLYGWVPALFTLLLYVFEPNIIAHSQLVTTDIYAAGMVAASTYTLWRYSQSPGWKRALVFALVLALSQLAKYTSVFLYPLLAVLLLVHDLPDLLRLARSRQFYGLWVHLRRLILLACLVVMVSLLMINAGYLFNRTFSPFSAYDLKSEILISLRSSIPILAKIPVPLPYPYLQGLDLVVYRERTTHGRGPNYLLGQISNQSFPDYYLVAWLYKVPLAIQIAFILAVGLYLFRRKGRHFLQNEWFLAGPVLFFTLYLDLFNRAQIGIRFFLVVFPFVLIFCGSLLVGWQAFRQLQWAGAGLLGAFLVGSVLGHFPNYIPYFNELLPDHRLAYEILADSNINWGQADWYLQEYLKAHSVAQFEPVEPVTGLVVVNPNDLVGITTDQGTYRWLRESYHPVETIADVYLVFRIPAP